MRPRQGGVAGDVLHQRRGALEIDIGRAERRRYPRGAVRSRPEIAEVALQRVAVELGLEAVEYDAVRTEAHIALGAERPSEDLPVAAGREPRDERARIPCFDAALAGKSGAPSSDVDATAQSQLRSARRAQFERLQIPCATRAAQTDRKSTRLNSSHRSISYAVF